MGLGEGEQYQGLSIVVHSDHLGGAAKRRNSETTGQENDDSLSERTLPSTLKLHPPFELSHSAP